jgi:hypothetical protein
VEGREVKTYAFVYGPGVAKEEDVEDLVVAEIAC